MVISMNYFIDVAYNSINKYGEELCGDKVEIVKTNDFIIIVLSDGLGSGVKANILSSLTSKIAATMLKEGATIYETVDTIIHTLPICNIRKLAYSTFTIIKIYNDGRIYVAEYDNPPFFIVTKNKYSIFKNEVIINDKIVKESAFKLEEGDIITVVSDGVVHAGVGDLLNMGWQWENIMEYLKEICKREKCANGISKNLIEVCNELYGYTPGDDATVVSIMLRKPELVCMFAGPPEDTKMDSYAIEKLMHSEGMKVICGGTAANIAARELNEELIVDMDYNVQDIPPTARLRGIDLVTEGVLTLNKTVEKLKKYSSGLKDNDDEELFSGKDGASRLARILVEDCTHLNMIVGKAINPAHQNPSFPRGLSIKLNILLELAEIMKKLGKEVNIEYV